MKWSRSVMSAVWVINTKLPKTQNKLVMQQDPEDQKICTRLTLNKENFPPDRNTVDRTAN